MENSNETFEGFELPYDTLDASKGYEHFSMEQINEWFADIFTLAD